MSESLLSAGSRANVPAQPVRRFVLLDRDGVINRRVPRGYVTAWEQFEFLPRALDALRLFAEHYFTVLVISNQACVGKELLSHNELERITRRFQLEVALSGGLITQVYYCTHRAEDHCVCRKPQPGLLLRAQREHQFLPGETFFVGDSASDLLAARAAGCRSILVGNEFSLGRDRGTEKPAKQATNLYEAAQWLVAIPHPSNIRSEEHVKV